MRKLPLLTVILITVCLTGAFAELTGVGDPSATGSVTVITGYDLDTKGFGFVNDTDLTITLPLFDGSKTAGGDDGMYGEITIDGIGWSLDDDEGLYDSDEDSDAYGDLDASISAALHIDPLVITLGQPDFEINTVDVSDDYAVDANADASADTGGISIGYVSDMISATFMIATENDYRDDSDDVDDNDYSDDEDAPFNNEIDDDDDAEDYTPNDKYDMVFGLAVSLAPAEGVTADVSFMYDADFSGTDALMGIGADIGLDMAPLTVAIPIDFVSLGKKSGFEVMPSVDVALMDNFSLGVDLLFGSYTNVVGTDLESGADSDGDGTPDVVTFDIENPLVEASVSVTDSGAFVDALSWTLAFTLADMLNYAGTTPEPDVAWDLDMDIEYAMGGLTPYVNFGLDETNNFDLGLGAKLGADFTGLDNTTITIDYTNEGFDDENGRVTCDVTVSF